MRLAGLAPGASTETALLIVLTWMDVNLGGGIEDH